jgi:hypothetical protein
MKQWGEKYSEAVKTDRRGLGVRSEPGRGEAVYLCVMGDAWSFGFKPEDIPNNVCYSSAIREDYARCDFPVVLKVKPGTDKRFVVTALRDYANNIEASECDEFTTVKDDWT